jgi:hypothetical protein
MFDAGSGPVPKTKQHPNGGQPGSCPGLARKRAVSPAGQRPCRTAIACATTDIPRLGP